MTSAMARGTDVAPAPAPRGVSMRTAVPTPAQAIARVPLPRDLHDDVCQELVSAALSIASVAHADHVQDVPSQHALAMLQQSALEIADRIRRIAQELRPPALRRLGLAGAVRTHCREIGQHHAIGVTLVMEGELTWLHPDVALCLFRITQEALRNAAVHSTARFIHVSLSRLADDIELVVHDDGCGFDVEATRRAGRGLGLAGVNDRAHAAGGEVVIVSRPHAGTTLLARVPARQRHPERAAAGTAPVAARAARRTFKGNVGRA